MQVNHLLILGLASFGATACVGAPSDAPSAGFEVAPGQQSVRLDLKRVP